MGLGAYQTMTTIAKKVGGPFVLATITFVSGYVVLRPAEAGVKKAARAVKRRNEPCAEKGQLFRAGASGTEGVLTIQAGAQFRVLEGDGDSILIDVLGDPNSPYFVSSAFLRSISDFQAGESKRPE